MHRMEGGAFAYATQHGTQHGAEGVTRHHSIQSNQSPRAIRAMVESGVNSNVIFSFKGYGKVSQSFGELTTHFWGSTTGDQPARQVGPGQCCQATVLHDDAGQAIMETGEVNPLEEISTASRWWSTSRDYPALHANRNHQKGFLKTGEVVNPRCNENRGSAAQHF